MVTNAFFFLVQQSQEIKRNMGVLEETPLIHENCGSNNTKRKWDQHWLMMILTIQEKGRFIKLQINSILVRVRVKIYAFINLLLIFVSNIVATSGLVIRRNSWQNPKINVIGPNLVSQLQSLSNHQNVVSLCLFKYVHDNCSNELSMLQPRLHEYKRNTRLVVMSHNFIIEISNCNRVLYETQFLLMEFSSDFLLGF